MVFRNFDSPFPRKTRARTGFFVGEDSTSRGQHWDDRGTMGERENVLLNESAVLVTGGTGSFGNFIVHRLLELGVKEVRILSRDEKKQYDLKVFYKGRPNLSFVIGYLRDRHTVAEA